MELILGGLGGLAILGLVTIAGVVAYIILHKLKPRKEPKRTGYIGITKCPLCGGRMESVPGAPHIIYCTTPNCPNYRNKSSCYST
jgi:hypothetical protein